VWGKGIQVVARSGMARRDQAAAKCGPVVLTDLQGRGFVRQRSHCAAKPFCYFFGEKSKRAICKNEQQLLSHDWQ
jgi:hypothetical protein